MAKGLLRSLRRAKAADQLVVKKTVAVNSVVNVAATSTAKGFGTGVIGGLPEGNILILGVIANLAFAGPGASADLSDTWNGDFAIGSTPNADVTLSGTEVDVVPETAVGPASSEVVAKFRTAVAAQSIIDNTAGTGELNLNILIDAADIGDDTNVDITVTGEVYLAYMVLGDD